MALVKCPECGKEISDRSKMCIHCGYPLEGESIETIFVKCPECGQDVPNDTTNCIYCGCPLNNLVIEEINDINKNESIKKYNKNVMKIIVPVVALVIITIIVIGIYNAKIVKPKNTYNEAVALLEKGKYEEANELFGTIKGYSDVDEILEQLKYESYAYSAINSIKKYLKNPDSYQPYEITFYLPLNTEENEKGSENNEEQFPVCIMHYGAQNGFGGNTTGYAICTYDSDIGEYKYGGSCDSLDEDDYDKDNDDDLYDLLICGIINLYRDSNDSVGSINLNRLKTVLKNDAYLTIKIIE